VFRALRRLHQRVFAATLHKGHPGYDAAVAPHKRALLGGLSGRVLEIGPGPGVNLHFLAPGVDYVGLEPNPYMASYLHREAERCGIRAELLEGRAERIPLPDASVDAVVSSLVLCSVGDVGVVLGEIHRVLKPGGRFVFSEHVAAPEGSGTRRLQRLIRPLARTLGDGCTPDRETWKAIEAAGFAQVELAHHRMPVPVYGPHIFGTAVKGPLSAVSAASTGG